MDRPDDTAVLVIDHEGVQFRIADPGREVARERWSPSRVHLGGGSDRNQGFDVIDRGEPKEDARTGDLIHGRESTPDPPTRDDRVPCRLMVRE